MSKGSPRLLQFTVNLYQFALGRINPHIPLEDSDDCGANTLLLLNRIDEQIAVDLSNAQNICKHGNGRETSVRYLFGKFLFTEIGKKYEFKIIDNPEELLQFVTDELDVGKGTVLFMSTRDAGHYVCIQKEESGHLSILDLQNGVIVSELGDFAPYERFVVPTVNLKRSSEEIYAGKKQRKNKRKTRKHKRKN